MKELVRAVGGLLTILTLLGLVVVDVLVSGASVTMEQLRLLTVLVGALLGLDYLVDRIPVSVDIQPRDGESGGGDNDR